MPLIALALPSATTGVCCKVYRWGGRLRTTWWTRSRTPFSEIRPPNQRATSMLSKSSTSPHFAVIGPLEVRSRSCSRVLTVAVRISEVVLLSGRARTASLYLRRMQTADSVANVTLGGGRPEEEVGTAASTGVLEGPNTSARCRSYSLARSSAGGSALAASEDAFRLAGPGSLLLRVMKTSLGPGCQPRAAVLVAAALEQGSFMTAGLGLLEQALFCLRTRGRGGTRSERRIASELRSSNVTYGRATAGLALAAQVARVARAACSRQSPRNSEISAGTAPSAREDEEKT